MGMACDRQSDCKSVAFCGDACYLKGKSIAAHAPSHYNKYCTTYRRDEGTDDMCFNLFSSMAFNSLLQSFPNNPDSHAAGGATFKLCTNGTLIADTALVYGGQTPLIASPILYATNGNGESGSGPPVISFCGSNTPGLINATGPYPEECKPYMAGSSNNANMTGYFIPGENQGTSLSERVRDIPASPVGMCRGVMKLSDMSQR